jgi:N6-adenosine-specific RNA methylase IME4
MGDIDALAVSIERIGLLHPVVVTPSRTLIAGERQLLALRKLGRQIVDATVIDIDKIARGEYAENIERKDFTWTEAVAIKKAIEPIERVAARERQREGGRAGGKACGKLPQASAGKSRDKAAKSTGKKARTLAKAEVIVDAANMDPRLFGDLPAKMDAKGEVDSIFKEMNIRKHRSQYQSKVELGGTVADLKALVAAGKKYAAILADPPWEFRTYSPEGKQRSAETHYDTLSLKAIKELPVETLAADDCALFLWSIWADLPGAIQVVEAWGFEFKTCAFIWVKQNRDGNGLFTGMGYWTRANSEPCLIATRGSPLRMAADVRQVILAPAGKHSEKPKETHSRIERLVVGPYLELFGRVPQPGWTVWGNELFQQAAE